MGGGRSRVPGPLEAADHLRDIARRTAVSAEANRRLDPEFIAALKQSGLAAAALPATVGGSGGDVPSLLEAIRRIAHGDGSAGWVTMIYASSSLTGHYLEAEGLREVFSEGAATLSSGVLAPRGTARPVGKGHKVSGRWPFASGSLDASWISLGAMVDGTQGDSSGILNFYLPMTQVEIVDTWDVIGLRATGSHDVVVTERQVPSHLAFDLAQTPRTNDPIARFPIYGLLAACIGAVSLGIARAAIEEACELGGVKVPTGSKRRLVDRPAFHEALARAESLIESATFYLFGRASRADGPATTDDRARLRMAASYAVESSRDAVELMYRAAGGSSVYSKSPLQRHLRDVHTATQHMMVAQPTWELTGRVLAGLETDVSVL